MMWIWILLAIVLVALLIPLFNRSRGMQTQPPTSPATDQSAMEILEDRYARGEIDREEFEKKKRDLSR